VIIETRHDMIPHETQAAGTRHLEMKPNIFFCTNIKVKDNIN